MNEEKCDLIANGDYTIRPAGWDDLEQVTELVNICSMRQVGVRIVSVNELRSGTDLSTQRLDS